MAIKVTLREKLISKGKKSLYLDFYPPIMHPKTGKLTRREFINMYLFMDKKEIKLIIDKLERKLNNNKNEAENLKNIKTQLNELKDFYKSFKGLNNVSKKHNTETLNIANAIQQKRFNELNKSEIYNDFEKERLKIKELGAINFIKYYEEQKNKRKGSNYDNWDSCYKHLVSFYGEVLKFEDLSQKKIEDFRDYLLTAKSNRSEKETLSQNSALSYFNKVKFVLKQAYKDGILQIDLNAKVKPIKEAETRREFLTIEELNKLVKTECTNPLLKKIALFSALTGMAFKEIQNLKWRDIKFIEGEGYLVLCKRQKTQRDNYLPISEQAFSLCGNHPGNPDENVFPGLKYSAYNNKQLTEWIEAAGIAKNITFHCFRHTFATLQLYNGTDIYTVSKMLGHKDLKTTQIYAKIVDEAKRTAANKIKLDNL